MSKSSSEMLATSHKPLFYVTWRPRARWTLTHDNRSVVALFNPSDMSDPAAASTQEEQGMVVDAPQVLENAPAAASGEQVATAEGAAPAAAESSSGVQVFHPSSATVPGQ